MQRWQQFRSLGLSARSGRGSLLGLITLSSLGTRRALLALPSGLGVAWRGTAMRDGTESLLDGNINQEVDEGGALHSRGSREPLFQWRSVGAIGELESGLVALSTNGEVFRRWDMPSWV